MYEYKYEIHLHSSRCSKCAVSTAEEMVRAAKQNGYAGVVFTNHFYYGNTAVDRSLPWAAFVEEYRRDWLDAKKIGDELGVEVIFGIEEGIGDGKEALIYGLDPEVIANENAFIKFDLAALSDFVHKNGGIIAAAHPFRDRSYIKEPNTPPIPSFFDAIETYNKCNSSDGKENEKAEHFAKAYSLPFLSGGDTHSADNFGGAGLAFPCIIKNTKEFANAIKARQYKLIIGDELVDPQ